MAKTVSCFYKNEEELLTFIEHHELDLYPSILVQAFVGRSQTHFIPKLQQLMKTHLPQAVFVGCTSFGEIVAGEMVEEKIGLSFTIFEKTELDVQMFDCASYESSEQIGKAIARSLISLETKLVLIFCTYTGLHLQSMLDGFYTECSDVIVAGGVACTNGEYNGEMVFTKDAATNQGVVAVAINNKDLFVHTLANQQWQQIGRSFKVTKVDGHVLSGIEHQRPIPFLRRYLGTRFVERLPSFGSEFPFFIVRNGEMRPVFIKEITPDGSLYLSMKLQEGESISIAFPNLEKIIEVSERAVKELMQIPVETLFIYNCVARRESFRPLVQQELQILRQLVPVNGFFSCGEIAVVDNNSPPRLLSQALTYVAISESKEVKKRKKEFDPSFVLTPELNSMIALTHLINASADDIHALNKNMVISEEYYRSLFDNNTDFIYSTDLKGRFTSINSTFIHTFGYGEEEIIGKSALQFIRKEDIPRVKRHFYGAKKGIEQVYDIHIPTKRGDMPLFQIKNIPITINGKCVGIYGVGRDITVQRKNEERIVQLAYYDKETGLPNRTKFTERLENTIGRGKHQACAVMFLDVDRFKFINDTYGHVAGDELLRQIGERIKSALPTNAFLGRFHSDKFSIFITSFGSRDDLLSIGEQIFTVVQKPFYVGQHTLYITVSIGVSVYPQDAHDAVTLFKHADVALSKAKQSGRNEIVLFSHEMYEHMVQRVQLENELRNAIKEQHLSIVYQPIVCFQTNLWIGAEALIRWHHPKLGPISPAQFIPISEETGMINEIGNWVLKEACRQTKQWHDAGYNHLSVSVNVSAKQFQQLYFTDIVYETLLETKLPPNHLQLELTESVMIDDFQHATKTFEQLQEIGVKISIDDFGTGYSSLNYLKNLSINNLKIDRTFIQHIGESRKDYAIVQSIIMMGKGLDMSITAEGIETKDQLELLQASGCQYGQGFYIYPPLKPNDFLNEFQKLYRSKQSIEK
ncbi:EAL domain-containing protein [Aeribacillus pallidus]|uniref:bifunctional diguanylate cyclase/phosphodiesterase n=1 Tax=Aeribacillus pallidus TaxID=33936 RepID=UPI003D19633F